MSHIESELEIANQLSVNVRQKEGLELPFVEIIPLLAKVEIIVDARNQEAGKY